MSSWKLPSLVFALGLGALWAKASLGEQGLVQLPAAPFCCSADLGLVPSLWGPALCL